MSPPDPSRPRRYTVPPIPTKPDADDWKGRVISLEHQQGRLDEKQAELARDHEGTVSELKDIKGTLNDIKTLLTVVSTERQGEKEKARFWSKIWAGVAVSVVLAFGAFLFRVAMVMQSNKLPPISP